MKKINILFLFSVLFLLFGLVDTTHAVRLDQITSATTTNTIDNLNFAQTWNWSTASTQNPFSFNFNGLTSGTGLRIISSATGLTGSLGSITLSGNNSANTGNLLLLNQSGASSAAIPLNITNSGTGNSLSITSGTMPLVVTSSGNVGIGTNSPSQLLSLGTAGTTAGKLTLAGSTSGLITLQTPAAAGSWTLTFPSSAGSGGQCLKTDGSGNASWASVLDSELSLSDITTNDVSTTKHGFAPKAPDDTTKFLRGDGTWSTPISQTPLFGSGQTSRLGTAGTGTQNVAHGLGKIPALIKVSAFWGADNGDSAMSIGSARSTSTDTVSGTDFKDGGVTNHVSQSGTDIINVVYNNTAKVVADVSAIDSTNFTLNFTTMNATTGSVVYIQWEVFGY